MIDEKRTPVPRSDDHSSQSIDQQALQQLLHSMLPTAVLQQAPEITVREDDVFVVLHVQVPTETESKASIQDEQQLIARLREETRRARITISRSIERSTGWTITWGMQAGKTVHQFTPNTRPVMTRLSAEERQILDTLVAANIARTRSAALGYLVRLFATDYRDWLDEIQESLAQVEAVRERLTPHPRAGAPPADNALGLPGAAAEGDA
ncbi:MAG TPA: hypothetical protein VKX46_01630 [Ktedonobacteraceae bacterium]|nr:hypothetical protein [Ktedonobacteraceae bacterium]